MDNKTEYSIIANKEGGGTLYWNFVKQEFEVCGGDSIKYEAEINEASAKSEFEAAIRSFKETFADQDEWELALHRKVFDFEADETIEHITIASFAGKGARSNDENNR